MPDGENTHLNGKNLKRALINIDPSPEQLTILSDSGPGFRLIRGAAEAARRRRRCCDFANYADHVWLAGTVFTPKNQFASLC